MKKGRILDIDIDELLSDESQKKFCESLFERYTRGEKLDELLLAVLIVNGKIPADTIEKMKAEEDRAAKNKFNRPKKVS